MADSPYLSIGTVTSPATNVVLRVLGPLEVVQDNQPIRLPGPKPTALLAMLAVHAGTAVSRDRLVDLLWHGEPPAASSAVLRTYVTKLRRVLGPTAIQTSQSGYALQLDRSSIDSRVFEQRIARARDEPAVARAELQAALAMWRGPAFGDLAAEEAILPEAQRLEETRWVAFEDRIDLDLDAAEHAQVVGELRGLVAEQPLRERLLGQLIVALYRSGRNAEALREYEGYRRRLAEELGVEPSPALKELEYALLTHDSSLGSPPSPAVASRQRHNLPAAVSAFVGRSRETEEVVTLVRQHRLVTLIGTGGCGKTRLAIELGRALLDEHSDGVWLAELAPLARAEQVAPTIAAQWGLQETGSRHIDERVLEYAANRDLLLIIDNCEHLIEGAADLIDRMLRSAPTTRVLATSRERLGVDGEVTWRVPSLALPDAEADLDLEAIAGTDAVCLFVDRARRSQPGFALTAENVVAVAEMCRSLDGIPLAIELAAARSRSFTPAEIVDHLDERFTLLTGGPRTALPRQRTLRALTDWSWDLLSESEARLMRRLADDQLIPQGVDHVIPHAVLGW